MLKVINSPIRWAGSKKKILTEMLETFKEERENYIECFLGSGIVLLNVLNNVDTLKYKNYYVNDINCNIITFYNILKNDVDFLINNIQLLIDEYNVGTMSEKEMLYYKVREKFNNEDDKNIKAIYFLFLMKSGFNGVYRENRSGKFNVPFGKKEKIVIDSKYLKEISNKIQRVEFYNLPYEDFLLEMKRKKAIENSFIYFDPPYLPDDASINKTHLLYTKESFNHRHFVEIVLNLQSEYFMISMSDSQAADAVYNNKGLYKEDMNEIVRTINPRKIFSSKEIVFTNYKIR